MTDTTTVSGKARLFSKSDILVTFIITSTDDPLWTELSVGIHPPDAPFSGTYGPSASVYLSASEFASLCALIPTNRTWVNVSVEYVTATLAIIKLQYKDKVYPTTANQLRTAITEIPRSGEISVATVAEQAATGT